MLFSSTFSRDIRRHGKRFTLHNILSVRPDLSGVYIFYYRRIFVYVGQSTHSQGIRNRLVQHYNASHNLSFSVWLAAFDGDIQFTHISCCDQEVDDLERSLIRHLQPITNKTIYRDYLPFPVNWRKTYG